jgi:hypothetical protein
MVVDARFLLLCDIPMNVVTIVSNGIEDEQTREGVMPWSMLS